MSKEVPCYMCEKRHNGCHSECESYKQYHDKIVAKREIENKKRAEEAILTDLRANAAYKQKKKKANVKYWKG